MTMKEVKERSRPSIGESEEGLVQIDRPIDRGLGSTNDEHRLWWT
jgi:hypothetical protein